MLILDLRDLASAGALCHLELKHFAEAVNWCDEGLQIDAKEKKLLEMRAKADKLKRMEERDLRKAKLKEKKEQSQNEALLQAIKVSSQTFGHTVLEIPWLREARRDLCWMLCPRAV